MLQCEKPYSARGPVPNVACLPPAAQVACAPVKGQLTVVPEKSAVVAAKKTKEQKCREATIWWIAAIVLGVIVIGLVWNWIRMNNAKNASAAASGNTTNSGSTSSPTNGSGSALPEVVPGAVAGAVAGGVGGAIAQPDNVTVNVDVYNQQPAVVPGATQQTLNGKSMINGIAGMSLPVNADRETAAKYLRQKYPAGRYSDSTQSINKSSDLEHCLKTNYGALVLYSMRGCRGCESVKPFMRAAAAQLNVPVIDVERENIKPADRPANYPFAFLLTPSQNQKGQLVHYPIDFSKTISTGGVQGLIQHINKIGCANGVKLVR